MRNTSSIWCMTWKTPCFVRPHINEKPVFLNLLPGGPFWETCVSGARKRRLRVNGRLKGRKKNPFPKLSRFKDIHTCARGNTDSLIGHFWVPPGLCFKTRLSAQPLICKWFFILMQIKLIFTRKVVHLASFWKWGFWNSEVAHCYVIRPHLSRLGYFKSGSAKSKSPALKPATG